jgi:cysteine-S-conjugate beta-lyase
VTNPLLVFPTGALRRRRSVKWNFYGPDVLPAWVAELDVELAEPIRLALSDAVRRGDTGYAHAGGLAQAYATFAARRFDWCPDPAAMSLCGDVMQGICAVLQAVTEPGARVVVTTPVYPPFFSYLADAGREVVPVPLDAAYRLDPVGLEEAFAAGARALLLCNPHNPTGTVFSRAELIAVALLAQRYGVRVLVDEIHSPLVYSGAVHTPFQSLDLPAARESFVFVSASQAWNLAGLKAALIVAGPDALDDRERLSPNAAFGAGLFGVIAGEVALREGGEWLGRLLAGLDHNRRLLAELIAKELPEIGYRLPEATYLAWLDCRALDLGDDPAQVFLERGQVAVNSGLPFGEPGRGHVRLNFGTHPDLLVEAVHRMAQAVSR